MIGKKTMKMIKNHHKWYKLTEKYAILVWTNFPKNTFVPAFQINFNRIADLYTTINTFFKEKQHINLNNIYKIFPEQKS